jgi:hypothetical protein
VRLALADVSFRDGALVHALLVHELERAVIRAFDPIQPHEHDVDHVPPPADLPEEQKESWCARWSECPCDACCVGCSPGDCRECGCCDCDCDCCGCDCSC